MACHHPNSAPATDITAFRVQPQDSVSAAEHHNTPMASKSGLEVAKTVSACTARRKIGRRDTASTRTTLVAPGSNRNSTITTSSFGRKDLMASASRLPITTNAAMPQVPEPGRENYRSPAKRPNHERRQETCLDRLRIIFSSTAPFRGEWAVMSARMRHRYLSPHQTGIAWVIIGSVT